jgi:purine-binding chemotaxis protein CheW
MFSLGDEEFGLGIEHVQSIVRYEEATPVPRAPEAVQGVVNMRGQVIPVLDLSKRLRKAEFTPGPLARIIVAEGEGGIVGLAVDAAHEVVSIPVTEIQQAPETVLTAETSAAFEGVTETESGLVILLDLDEAVPKAEYARVAEAGDDPGGGTDV